MPLDPPRSDRKTIRLPSGDQRAIPLLSPLQVSRRLLLPSRSQRQSWTFGFFVSRSVRASAYTIVEPSGEIRGSVAAVTSKTIVSGVIGFPILGFLHVVA